MRTESQSPLLFTLEAGVARLRFNRPAQLNTINAEMADAFAAACRTIEADPTVRVVVLSGEGRGFGAGGDLVEMKAGGETAAAALIGPMHDGLTRLAALDAPVIASLHGTVAGGTMSLALACDLAIAAEGTRFNLAYVNIGASCDLSSSYHLPRAVGLRRALGIALLGETLDANDALALGLVNRVVPADRLADETEAWVRRFADGPTRAVGRLKRLFRASSGNDLPTQLALEREAFVASTHTADFQEGLSAFFAKRKPVFTGG